MAPATWSGHGKAWGEGLSLAGDPRSDWSEALLHDYTIRYLPLLASKVFQQRLSNVAYQAFVITFSLGVT